MGGRGSSIRDIASDQKNFGFEKERLRIIVAESQSTRKEGNREIRQIFFRSCCCCESYTIPIESEYSTCPNCKWIDDPFQNANPDNPNGRNSLSLNAAKTNFKLYRRIIK